MARPGRPERNRAAQSFRQLRRFHHAINSDEVFGTHRAARIAPNAEKFDNQKPRAASFLFVRRGTQSYDEFVAAVPLRPRLSMMLGMINTSDIFSIGENASARI